MQVQVKSKADGKYLGYIIGYAIYDCVSWVLVAKDGGSLEDYLITDLVVISVNEEGGCSE